MKNCWMLFPRYELWKPNLRSTMEYDMKEVSIGNKSKAEVLATCLQQMKACFLDVSCQMAHRFSSLVFSLLLILSYHFLHDIMQLK